MRGATSGIRRRLMPVRIVEWRVHQDAGGAVRRKARRAEGLGLRLYIERNHAAGDAVQRRVLARERHQHFVAIDQRQIEMDDATRQREGRGTYAGAELNHMLARPRVRRGRKQHRVVAGAMTLAQLAQAQSPAEKGVFGDIVAAAHSGRSS
jgi:hypothetical protein